YTFRYELTGADVEACDNVCFDCVYDLEISIVKADCGTVIYENTRTLGSLAGLDYTCNEEVVYEMPDQVLILEAGQYTITRSLCVNEEARQTYADLYLENCAIPLEDFITDALAQVDYSGCDKDYCDVYCLEELGPDATPAELAACRAECEDMDHCTMMRRLMLRDLSPGGQYAQYEIDDATGAVTATDPYSVLNADPQTNAFLGLSPSPEPYANLGNDPLSYWHPDVKVNLPTADPNYTLADLVADWEPAWAEELLPYHPEFCELTYCEQFRGSNEYDAWLKSIQTYDDAVAEGLIISHSNGTYNYPFLASTLSVTDPNFVPGSQLFADLATDLVNVSGSGISYIDLVPLMVHMCHVDLITDNQSLRDIAGLCANEHPLFSDDCTRDQEWRMLRQLFLASKIKVTERARSNSDCANMHESQLAEPDDPAFSLYRVTFQDNLGLDLDDDPQDLWNQTSQDVNQGFEERCQTQCESMADYWYGKLVGCQLTPAQKTAVLAGFIEVCKTGCGPDNPIGVSSLISGASPNGYTSFCDVMEKRLSITNNPNAIDNDPNTVDFNPDCNCLLINSPPPEGHSLSSAGSTFPILDTCACDMILENESDFFAQQANISLPNGVTNSYELFAHNHGEHPDYNSLKCDCEKAFAATHGQSANWSMPAAWKQPSLDFLVALKKPIPEGMACSHCVDCQTIFGLYEKYPTLAASPEGLFLLANKINQEIGFNLTPWDYEKFKDDCTAWHDANPCDRPLQIDAFANWLDALASQSELTSYSMFFDQTEYPEFFDPILYQPGAGCSGTINVETAITYSREFDGEIVDIRALDNDQYVALGLTTTGDLMLGEQNLDGRWSWTTSVGLTGVTWRAKSMQLHYNKAEGRYLALGIVDYNGNSRTMVVEFKASNGTYKWNKLIDTGTEPAYILGANAERGAWFIGFAVETVERYEASFMMLNAYTGNLINATHREDLGGVQYSMGTPDGHLRHVAKSVGGRAFILSMAEDHNALTWSEVSIGGSGLTTIRDKKFTDFEAYCAATQYSMVRTSNSKLVMMVSDSTDFDRNLRVFQTDLRGNIEWSYDYQLAWGSWGLNVNNASLTISENGGVNIAGVATGGTYNRVAFHLQLDQNGQKVDAYMKTASHESHLIHSFTNGHRVHLTDRTIVGNRHSDFGAACNWVPIDVVINTKTLATDVYPDNQTTLTPTLQSTSVSIGSDKNDYITACPERMRLITDDGCGQRCTTMLHMPAGIPGGSFASLTGMNQALPVGDNFRTKAQYSYTNGNMQVTITGNNSCIGPCPTLPLCNKSFIPMGLPDPVHCRNTLEGLAIHDAIVRYNRYRDELRTDFLNDYDLNCLRNASETMEMDYELFEHHFTLYYYDQAGSLVRTVPPEGVDDKKPNEPGFDTFLAQVKQSRETNSLSVVPQHRLNTLYEYNSLGQLVWNSTPDGGEAEMWYDALGRVVLSRNAKQKAEDHYSYVFYDGLGRTVEGGELTNAAFAPNNIEHTVSAQDVLAFHQNSSGYRYRVRSTFDEPSSNPDIQSQFPEQEQQNLRNRVSYVEYFNEKDELEHATYYTYDIHGNVDFMVQELAALSELGVQYFTLRYDYDLISGNVNEVAYQEDKPDQFYHRYNYDADNRIQSVETSHDGVHWDADASYNYYDHGPLARVALGAEDVQGVDYAYTIQGWLKGVNSDMLKPEYDQGQDGGIAHPGFAKDAFGFSLHYFSGDYAAIGSSSFLAGQVWDAGLAATPARDLFNGNISRMATTLADLDPVNATQSPRSQLNAYKYDQLQRIREMQVVSQGISTDTWNVLGGPIEDYKTSYTYDANGNILSLK
ncbi:MAG: hypothetical protein AB8F95_02790, partial [Bacteroidia bacterium]